MDPKLQDKVVVERLVSFNDSLAENQTISKKTVLSLEEFIGYSVITSHIDIDRFTDYESGVCLEPVQLEIKKVLDEVSKTQDLKTRTTYADLSSEIIKSQNMTNKIKKVVASLRDIDAETIDRMLNQQYIYSYVDDDGNTVNDVYNIVENSPIHYVFLHRNDYLSAVLGNDEKGLAKFNRIKQYIDEVNRTENLIYAELSSPALMSVLKDCKMQEVFRGNHFHVGIFTLTDFSEFYHKIPEIISDLEEVLEMIEWDKRSLIDNHDWEIDGKQKELNKKYNFYKNYNSVVNDRHSLAILSMLHCIAE
jgi:hypothetical protein